MQEIPGTSEFKAGAGLKAGDSDAQQSGHFSTAQRGMAGGWVSRFPNMR